MSMISSYEKQNMKNKHTQNIIARRAIQNHKNYKQKLLSEGYASLWKWLVTTDPGSRGGFEIEAQKKQQFKHLD